ncbi:hypothetical protein ACU4GG_40655 [Streptomyces nojiriensis]
MLALAPWPSASRKPPTSSPPLPRTTLSPASCTRAWTHTRIGSHRSRHADRTTGTCATTLTGHTNEVHEVAISPDGAWLATTSIDQTSRIWAVLVGRAVFMVRGDGVLTSCVWGDAGDLAVGGEKGLYLYTFLT